MPPAPVPYPVEVGTATSGTPVRPPTTLGSAPSMPGDDDERVEGVELVADGEQPVQPGHADVVDPDRRGAVHRDRRRGLGGDRGVGGAGRDHPDPSARRRQRPDDGGAPDRVDDGSGHPGADGVQRLGGEPGGEHGAVGVPLGQRGERPDHLLGGLAGAVDHLGVAGAARAVGVQAGVAEVDDARAGRSGRARDRG